MWCMQPYDGNLPYNIGWLMTVPSWRSILERNWAFKKMHNLFGKFLMLYNFSTHTYPVYQYCLIHIFSALFKLPLNSQVTYHITACSSPSGILYEYSNVQIAYSVYRGHNLLPRRHRTGFSGSMLLMWLVQQCQSWCCITWWQVVADTSTKWLLCST